MSPDWNCGQQSFYFIYSFYFLLERVVRFLDATCLVLLLAISMLLIVSILLLTVVGFSVGICNIVCNMYYQLDSRLYHILASFPVPLMDRQRFSIAILSCCKWKTGALCGNRTVVAASCSSETFVINFVICRFKRPAMAPSRLLNCRISAITKFPRVSQSSLRCSNVWSTRFRAVAPTFDADSDFGNQFSILFSDAASTGFRNHWRRCRCCGWLHVFIKCFRILEQTHKNYWFD